jgi:hypothetical protein
MSGGLYLKNRLFFSDCYKISIFSKDFRQNKMYSDIEFYEFSPNGNRFCPCGQTDGRIDRDMTKLIIACRNFANVLKKHINVRRVNKYFIKWMQFKTMLKAFVIYFCLVWFHFFFAYFFVAGSWNIQFFFSICSPLVNRLNAELNPIRHLLALVGTRHFVDVRRIRVNWLCSPTLSLCEHNLFFLLLICEITQQKQNHN